MEFAIQNAIDAISLGSLYALISLGIGLIFGIMQLINFAHGELIMVGGYALFLIGHPPLPVLIFGTLLVAAIFAFLMERVAFRPVRLASPTTLLVTSFAVSYLLQQLAILIMGAQPKTYSISPVVTQQFVIGDLRFAKLSIITTLTTIFLLVVLALFLKRTPLGVQMRAAAEDFGMARLAGVRANTVIAAAFVISGILAGVVSILFIAQTGTIGPTIGLAPLLFGVIAVVTGGMASLPGAVLGGYILGFLSIGLQAGLPEHLRSFRDAFAFTVVILILLVRPQGLIGGRATVARV